VCVAGRADVLHDGAPMIIAVNLPCLNTILHPVALEAYKHGAMQRYDCGVHCMQR
jgi:hypothetical protein